jgi:5-methylcytosine-specific restriction endonuclease McrA
VIHVDLAPEPVDFHEKVRRPGLDAIAELVGEAPSRPRPGAKRTKVFPSREDIPARAFPGFWTEAIADLLDAYRRICAYSCLYIEPVTGSASVDHMIPKSQRWDLVYEWKNYRLACARMNSRKGALSTVLDPFDVEDGWFQLDLDGYQVRPAPAVSHELRGRIQDTIDALKLNDAELWRARGSYVQAFEEGAMDLEEIEARAPFVARELRRQEWPRNV